MKDTLRIGLAAVALAWASSSAQANSITVTETSAVNVPGGSQWSYVLSFDNSTMNNGDFVTINDFGPGTVVTSPAAGWTFSQLGSGPNSIPVTDNGSVLNATFTWAGGPTVISPSPSTIVTESLTLFSPATITGPNALSQYTTVDQASSGLVAGTDSRVVGYVSTPAVPDKGNTFALLAFGILGVEGLRRRQARFSN